MKVSPNLKMNVLTLGSTKSYPEQPPISYPYWISRKNESFLTDLFNLAWTVNPILESKTKLFTYLKISTFSG